MLKRSLVFPAILALCSGCGDGGNSASMSTASSSSSSSSTGGTVDPIAPEASQDWQRDLLSTGLELDLATKKGKATIRLAKSASTGASFEAGGLTIEGVHDADGELHYALTDGRLDVGVRAGEGDAEIAIDYSFAAHTNYDGYLDKAGVTFLWPKFCGNLFPCKSAPDDGLTFTMSVSGAPAGAQVIFPQAIATDAPSYMPALAFGDYTYKMLGTTKAGTKVGVWFLKGGDADADTGTKDLAGVFDFYEKTYGAYSFGGEVASVSANWGAGAFGGMEHHPFWHVASEAMSDDVTHAHEAAHGWFGNGVRMRCWEDFVLSEGTVSYMAARSLEVVGGAAAGQKIWDDYKKELDGAVMDGDTIALPDTCNKIDILTDPLWSSIPYMKGAFFYKKVAEQVGVDKLDAVIATFYKAHVGKAASMQDMLDAIKADTGFDPTVLAKGWLRSLGTP